MPLKSFVIVSEAPTISVCVQREDFNSAAEQKRMTEGRHDIGAVVSFVGLCRDEQGTLAALELEHYPGMAEGELRRIVQKCARRWPIQALTVVHRFGKFSPGDNIVLVIAASPHRQAAFDAAAFIMDFLKTSAPFWKKQHMISGGDSSWVSARSEDDEAADRW